MVVAGANVHGTKLLAMTLESVVVEHPEGRVGPQHLCLDKGYGNPTGHQAVAAHGYRGHIRRIGGGETGRQGRKTLSRAPLGGGAHPGLAIQVPGDLGALRQEGMQLHGPGAIGLRPALISPPTPTQVLRCFLSGQPLPSLLQFSLSASFAVKKVAPSRQQLPALLKQIRAHIGGFGAVADAVGQGAFAGCTRCARVFCRPIPKAGPESVGNGGNV